MIQCESCRRHYRSSESACPFCGIEVRSAAARAFRTLASGMSMAVLAACYGPPPGKYDTACIDTASTACDLDGDGYSLDQGDCDDADPNVSPGATEVCDDGIDNDCDALIDLDDSGDCVVGTGG